MARLNHVNTCPPGGWRFREPTTGTDFTGWTLGELVQRVIDHRRWKNLTPTDKETVTLEVERQICEAQYPGICRGEDGENYQPFEDQSRTLDPDKVVEATKAAFNFVKNGLQMVPKAESERRAAICRKCPYNRPSVCVCTPLYKMLDALIPADRREPGVFICNLCGCSISAKILVPIQESKYRFPSHCWQLETPDDQKTQEEEIGPR